MELLGYFALTFMGITLSLIGAGGSILTIPILVYLLKEPILVATSYSLALVGSTALFAALRCRHQILFKESVIFLIPSICGVFIARHFIIPKLPDAIGFLSIDQALITLLLSFIAISGYLMIKNSSNYTKSNNSTNESFKIISLGLALGIIMGILGAGGGFLIIPTLILLMGLSSKEAIPTSLFIITVNSFIGFAADKHPFITTDWINLIKYLIPAIMGMTIGLYVTKFMNEVSFKKLFGYFIWLMGIIIIIKEFF